MGVCSHIQHHSQYSFTAEMPSDQTTLKRIVFCNFNCWSWCFTPCLYLRTSANSDKTAKGSLGSPSRSLKLLSRNPSNNIFDSCSSNVAPSSSTKLYYPGCLLLPWKLCSLPQCSRSSKCSLHRLRLEHSGRAGLCFMLIVLPGSPSCLFLINDDSSWKA